MSRVWSAEMRCGKERCAARIHPASHFVTQPKVGDVRRVAFLEDPKVDEHSERTALLTAPEQIITNLRKHANHQQATRAGNCPGPLAFSRRLHLDLIVWKAHGNAGRVPRYRGAEPRTARLNQIASRHRGTLPKAVLEQPSSRRLTGHLLG